ncbi:hypothetical protein EYC80_003522 [Monilinia laxa]|uniref:Uncharacterized protein n=1 Tax=Monilinia laxa TaxID=61186 RepID=A0A5N6KKI4_MONLA|nr:hypothetical protein EYC80_003522 [Monilinia laxa]
MTVGVFKKDTSIQHTVAVKDLVECRASHSHTETPEQPYTKKITVVRQESFQRYMYGVMIRWKITRPRKVQ